LKKTRYFTENLNLDLMALSGILTELKLKDEIEFITRKTPTALAATK
jgi:hypothetical protein